MPNLLKIKRGAAATIPQGALAEPLFTTDTYDLYIGKGSGGNQRFQKYIASGTSSQFLKGDGSLDSTSYQTALTFSSPLVNTSGTVSIPAATSSVNGYLTSTDWSTFNSKEPAITAGTSSQYYRGDKTFQTLDTNVVPENGNIYFTEPRVRATVLTGLNLSGGGSIAATDSILTAFGKVQNQISALVGGATYQGTWNASTNSPSLASGTGTKGYYYVVSVAGSTNLDGITDWKVGDWAIFNGTTWDKVDNTDAVSSVNGFTGAVNLGLGNISDVTLSSPTNTQLLRFNGTSSKWENWTPTYISAAITSLNGLTGAIQTFATGTTGTDFAISSSSTTHTFNLPTASATNRGALSSADWSTFNGKQAQLNGTGFVKASGTTITYDNSTYLTTSAAASTYLPLSGGTLTGALNGTTANFTSNSGNFNLGSQADTAIYMHFGTKNATSGYGIAHRIAGTINATANFDNLHGLWVDYTDNVGAYVGVVKYAIYQPDSAKSNYFGGPTTFNSSIWAQSTISIGVNSAAYDLYIRKTAAYAMIESYTNSATSQLYFKAVNASLIAVTGGIIYTPSTSGNHNISITPDTTTTLGMILNTNSAGFGVIPKATTYYSLQSDYGVLSGNLAANISSNSYYNSGWKFYGTGYATLYNQDPSTGKHEFFTTSTTGSSGGSVTFGTAKLSIQQNGNVGIGTTSPGKLLTLESNGNNLDTGTVLRLIGNSAQDLVDISVSDTKTRIYHQENAADAANGYGILQLRTNATPNSSFPTRGGFQFTIGSTDAMFITSMGNVGIGTTTISGRLDVQASGISTFSYYFRNSAGGYGGGVYNTGANNTQLYLANSAGTENVLIAASGTSFFNGGNVGIGTTSPEELLELSSSDTTGGQLLIESTGSSTGNYSGMRFKVAGGSNGGYEKAGIFAVRGSGGYNDLSLVFATNTAATTANVTTSDERLRITSGGQIQMGANPPANTWTNLIFGSGTTNQSYGVKIIAGSSSSDIAFQVKDKDDSGERFRIRGDGNIFALGIYNNTSSSGTQVNVDSSGNLFRFTSSLRYKKDILDYDKGLDYVSKIKPVYFKSINENTNDKQFAGLIAEQLDEIGLNEFVEYNDDKQPDSIHYQNMVALLTKAIQEQQAQIEELKQKLS